MQALHVYCGRVLEYFLHKKTVPFEGYFLKMFVVIFRGTWLKVFVISIIE